MERARAGDRLLELAPSLTAACQAMAERFRAGGRLLALGLGLSGIDANHVAVEFVHPVIVGKRALPAISLTPEGADLAGAVRRHGRPEDICMGFALGEPLIPVREALEAACQRGLLTIALGLEGFPFPADHALLAPTRDPLIGRELHVTLYHILWETVHVFL